MSATQHALISVVVHGRNDGHLLVPTIKSVKRCISYTRECGLPVEIHLVLDRPDDKTISIAARELDRVGSLHQVDYGNKSKARNYGVKQSKGEYVAFLDIGDLWCQNWLIDAYLFCKSQQENIIVHPEYSITFGGLHDHASRHIDMDDPGFEVESFLQQNYWTEFSFGKTSTYKSIPFVETSSQDGFGFPEWTWNYTTVRSGIRHKVVTQTSHYIRDTTTSEPSVAGEARQTVIPNVLDVYRN